MPLLLKKHRSSPPFELWSVRKIRPGAFGGRRWPDSHLLSCRTRLSGAEVTSPMEGVTGMMAWLSHVPGCSRGGLYGPANIDFPFVGKLRLQRAGADSLFC